jgi:hypothetical protein
VEIGVDGPRAAAGPDQAAIVLVAAVRAAVVAIAIAPAQVEDSEPVQAGAALEAASQAPRAVLEEAVPGAAVPAAAVLVVAGAVPAAVPAAAVGPVGGEAVPASVAVLPAGAEAHAAREAPAAVRGGTTKVGPSRSPGRRPR